METEEKVPSEPIHEVPALSARFNKELEAITGKSSTELYDKGGKVKTEKTGKRAKKREEIKKILHPEAGSKGVKRAKVEEKVEEFAVLTKDLKIKLDSELRYKIIGFVTTGWYSLLDGCGRGISYVLNYEGSGIVPVNGKITAFVRNPNGRLYCPCTLLVLNNLPYAC